MYQPLSKSCLYIIITIFEFILSYLPNKNILYSIKVTMIIIKRVKGESRQSAKSYEIL